MYAHLVDDEHVAQLVAASEGNGTEVTLVQLAPSDAELDRRVRAASRIGTEKITDPATLRRLMIQYDLRTPARASDLTIDNSSLTPDDVARVIADHAGLT